MYSCKYCNTRKAQKIKKGESDKWIWPDKDNTFLAYTYHNANPQVNKEYLEAVSEECYNKAKALYDGIGLGITSHTDLQKDKRWSKRFETLGIANDTREAWRKIKGSEFEVDMLKQIVTCARQTGFFSIWMMVFEGDREVKLALIQEFPGTARTCFL